MREILFRGKRISDSEWVEGNLFVPDEGHNAPTQICIGTNAVRVTYDIDENTISEFTGLYDKNGKRVFEGDIANFTVRYHKNGEAMSLIKPVEFDSGSFFPVPDYMQYDYQIVDFEVIGNKWDNPELLEKK